MVLRRPDIDGLKRLAEANHFDLPDGDAREMEILFKHFLPFLDQLDAMPLPKWPLPFPNRTVSGRPEPAVDPLNAITLRCNVRGAGSGPLTGVRVGLKDSIAVAGMPMTCGSSVIRFVPKADATVVTRLLEAGAEITAILNMDSFAFSGAGDTSAYGPIRNPHDTSRLAGGSSGGSAAALAYDDIDLTLGSDQGGSIRIPASWCGVVGLKPTHALIPYTGIVGLDHGFDHVGPLARSVAEVAAALQVLAGRDPDDPRQRDVPVQDYIGALDSASAKGLRIGVLAEGFSDQLLADATADTVCAALDRLARAGADVRKVSLPDHRTAGAIAWGMFAEAVAGMLQANGQGYHWQGRYDPDLAVAFGSGLTARSQDLPPQGKFEVILGTYLRTAHHGYYYAKAQILRRELRQCYDALLGDLDVLAMPTTPMTAHRHDADLGFAQRVLTGWNMLGNTAPFNMTGHPSISIPCGERNGLPVGLMLTGKHFRDAELLVAAQAAEMTFGTA